MKTEDMQKWLTEGARWISGYHDSLDGRPVRPAVEPNTILASIPDVVPEHPEDMETIFRDFKETIPDGMTHWQHPRFFAYFNAIASPASIFGEMLADAMACNCMLWQTSPAGTELELRMLDWFRQAVGLSDRFSGLIQDGATLSNICAVLTMRERASGWNSNRQGLYDRPRLRIYASPENHSSIDKAIRVAGIGHENLVTVPTDDRRSMDASSLRTQIEADIDKGHVPAGVILCVGGTAAGAIDTIADNIAVAREFGLYVHVDAAWAGSAMICPELRWIWQGIDRADSIVINPTKMIGVQFDCSMHFLANPDEQSKAVSYTADYLQTESEDELVDISSMTLPLGRRFRALKLWFHFRAYGLVGMRSLVRNHVDWNMELRDRFHADPDFEVSIETPLSLFGFRYQPAGQDPDVATARLLNMINDDGRIYLTKSGIDGRQTIRVTGGTFTTTREDVLSVYDTVRDIADAFQQK